MADLQLDKKLICFQDSGAGHLFDSMDDDALGHWGLRSLVLWSNHLTSQMAKNLSRALVYKARLLRKKLLCLRGFPGSDWHIGDAKSGNE